MFKKEILNSRPGKEWLVNSGLFLSLLALCGHLHGAATINFGSTAFDPDQQSDGSPMDSTFSFQLGAFDNGFVPTSSNTSEWLDNWVAADLVDGSNSAIPGDFINYNDSAFFFPGFYANNIEGTAQLDSNAWPFNVGAQGYIWGYTQRGGTEPGEWILITNSNWTFPAAIPADGDPPANELWLVSELGTQTVVGNLNGAGYEMQSAMVPEPWSGLLLLVSAMGFGLRRRRRV